MNPKDILMFAKNVGGIDRVARIVIGLALIAGFFLNAEGSLRWLYLLGIVPLATVLFQTCGLYSILGINTCALKK
jgi:hypothetical protein